MSGVSIGSINAYILSLFKKGDEMAAAAKLKDFWDKIGQHSGNLAVSWSWGMIYGFFYEHSLYDASDLYQFIADYFHGDTVERHLNLGIANVLTGQFKSFKEHHPNDELIKVLQASLSYPGVYTAIEAFDSLWFTGSTIYEIDVLAPIIHCLELGYEESDIVVDVVLSGNPHMHHVYAKFYNAFAVA